MSTLATNKRAKFDYQILEVFEAGLVLTGAEVKSAKLGQVQLKGSFVQVRGNVAWLKNAFISAYKPAGKREDYDPYRDRKILLHQKEIKRFLGKQKAEGLTIVPVCVYLKRNLVKVELGLARGKRKYEKREIIKKRDVERQMREKMKGK